MTELSNWLPALAEDIRRAHEQVGKSAEIAAKNALVAGEMLVEAQGICAHGQWLDFVKSTGIPERSARRYMTLHRGGFNSATVAELGFAIAERYASLALKVLPGAAGRVIQLVGRDDDGGIAKRLTFCWREVTGLVGYWSVTLAGDESFYVNPARPMQPWVIGALLDGDSSKFSQYRSTEISSAEMQKFFAEFKAEGRA